MVKKTCKRVSTETEGPATSDHCRVLCLSQSQLAGEGGKAQNRGKRTTIDQSRKCSKGRVKNLDRRDESQNTDQKGENERDDSAGRTKERTKAEVFKLL